MVLGGGLGGGDDKHTRSTAADRPAPLPDYKVTWLWGRGFYRITKCAPTNIRRKAYMLTRMHTTTYMDSPAYIVTYGMRHTRDICHETYTPTSTDKRMHANTWLVVKMLAPSFVA